MVKAGSDQQLVELRHTIEVGYTKLAIEKITDSDLMEIKGVLDQHIAAVANGEKDLGYRQMYYVYLQNIFLMKGLMYYILN